MEQFKRQIKIVGKKGQEKLANARVSVIGVGGLGSVVAMYLAYAGVARLKLVDGGEVEKSNLNRQILYDNSDISAFKVLAASDRLRSLKSVKQIHTLLVDMNIRNVGYIMERSDIVIDCLDNDRSRKILCKAAVKANTPLVYGAVGGFLGYVSTVYHSACPWCFSQSTKIKDKSILGATCGVIGSIQALEAIKVITGIGEPLTNQVFYWDGFKCEGITVKTNRSMGCTVC